ncbi:MAG TPA: hypothetical protein VI776_04030, partial [Anaerolineales bacterium]|nr:hypothetical protein [Anaerolineales bacterium]
ISIFNRGMQPAEIHVLPTLWFRNTWSWASGAPRPLLKQVKGPAGVSAVAASHPDLGERTLYCQSGPDGKAVPLLFTENETNTERIFGAPNASPYVKDAFHNFIIHGQSGAVNPQGQGSKSAPYYRLVVSPGEHETIRLRLTEVAPHALKAAYPGSGGDPFGDFDGVLAERKREADEFYDYISPDSLSRDQASVLRQALAGMLWSKQYYYYDLDRWLVERGADPLSPGQREAPRNSQWYHMVNADVISMPDKWEYPWYAAWDLAFHTVALLMVDPDFAKEQLALMLREDYLHPNGQIPAYEWNFGDVNPPVHAWATVFTYLTEQQLSGQGDLKFLEHAFHKLALNFTWWINRKDLTGKNVFQGGFLGLDNIGVFDRSAPLPTGGHLEQADGTAWMVFYSQMMLQIAIELALHDPVYEDMAIKFYEHFLYIAAAMDRIGDNEDEMWDEQDGFYYDLLRLPDGTCQRLKVRSMVGLLPLCAATVFPSDSLPKLPRFLERARWIRENRPGLMANIHDTRTAGYNDRRLLSPLNDTKLRRVLAYMLDENEFLSPYGIRALSRDHLEHPFVLNLGGSEYRVEYLPAESNSGMFGGNSNWRGPIWMPMNALLVRALLQLYTYYGDSFQIECPTGSGNQMNLYQVAEEIANRLAGIFLRGADGRRPVFGGAEKLQTDPHWRDYILFYEYFHGDNGAGLGASHQTGWTGLIARLLQLFAGTDAGQMLQSGVRSSIDIHD